MGEMGTYLPWFCFLGDFFSSFFLVFLWFSRVFLGNSFTFLVFFIIFSPFLRGLLGIIFLIIFWGFLKQILVKLYIFICFFDSCTQLTLGRAFGLVLGLEIPKHEGTVKPLANQQRTAKVKWGVFLGAFGVFFSRFVVFLGVFVFFENTGCVETFGCFSCLFSIVVSRSVFLVFRGGKTLVSQLKDY